MYSGQFIENYREVEPERTAFLFGRMTLRITGDSAILFSEDEYFESDEPFLAKDFIEHMENEVSEALGSINNKLHKLSLGYDLI